MTLPFWCLFVAIFIPIVLAGIGGYHRSQQFGTPDNNAPRQQAAKLTGAGARAVAAQENAWEGLIVFACAVFVNHLAGGDPLWAGRFAIVFVLARISHAACYLADLATPRSLSYAVAMASCIALFVSAARA